MEEAQWRGKEVKRDYHYYVTYLIESFSEELLEDFVYSCTYCALLAYYDVPLRAQTPLWWKLA
jgi:hypothetical protein